MFVQATVALPLDATRARLALECALLDGGLTAESHRAYDEGLSFLMRVGPHGPRGIAKQVQVQTLPPSACGDTVTVPVRWEATGPARRLFPVLDANLDLTAAPDGTALLSLIGRYAPPLGRLGAPLDETLLSGVAHHTVDALLADIASRLTQLATDTPTAGHGPRQGPPAPSTGPAPGAISREAPRPSDGDPAPRSLIDAGDEWAPSGRG